MIAVIMSTVGGKYDNIPTQQLKPRTSMTQITVKIILVFLYLSPGSVTIARGQVTELLQIGNTGQCPSMEERERARNKLYDIINSTITNITERARNDTHQSTNSAITNVCNGTSGWRRVAFINMTDTSYNCPTGLNLTSFSKRTCGRSHTTWIGCSSTMFSVGGAQYSQVCGRIRGYQFGETTAFNSANQGIDSNYVAGISLTHGAAGSRQHIWTFAAGMAEVTTNWPDWDCPCEALANNCVPDFVGNDYFCESGLNAAYSHRYIFYPDDVLWDGQDCTSTSTCCQVNNPPWFTKNLPTATTDNIELRICTSYIPQFDDIPFELIELYVQ